MWNHYVVPLKCSYNFVCQLYLNYNKKIRSLMVLWWMWLRGQWHKKLWASSPWASDEAEDGRAKTWSNPRACWHPRVALSTNPGVHPSSELPVMWDNKVPYYSSQHESGFLLLVAKSTLADIFQQTKVTSQAGENRHYHLRSSGTTEVLYIAHN